VSQKLSDLVKQTFRQSNNKSVVQEVRQKLNQTFTKSVTQPDSNSVRNSKSN